MNKLLASDYDDKDDAFSKLFGAGDLAGLEAELSKQARARELLADKNEEELWFSDGRDLTLKALPVRKRPEGPAGG